MNAVRIANDAIVAAQARQQLYADRGRVAADFNVGDMVLVHRDFLTTAETRDQPSHKLRPKWFGPFAVLQTIGTDAYRLDLPSIIYCHFVLSVHTHSLFTLFTHSTHGPRIVVRYI